jgi:hypothetical protein
VNVDDGLPVQQSQAISRVRMLWVWSLRYNAQSNTEGHGMIQMTQEQWKAARNGEPVWLHSDEADFVVLRADMYQRLRALLEKDFAPSEAYPAVDRAFAEGWNDPKMDDYDRYEELKP